MRNLKRQNDSALYFRCLNLVSNQQEVVEHYCSYTTLGPSLQGAGASHKAHCTSDRSYCTIKENSYSHSQSHSAAPNLRLKLTVFMYVRASTIKTQAGMPRAFRRRFCNSTHTFHTVSPVALLAGCKFFFTFHYFLRHTPTRTAARFT